MISWSEYLEEAPKYAANVSNPGVDKEKCEKAFNAVCTARHATKAAWGEGSTTHR